jgi:hypothetical protein
MTSKTSLLIIIVLAIAGMVGFLFFGPTVHVLHDINPTDRTCNTISDCPIVFPVPGLTPTECKENEGKKVCWYGEECSGSPICQINQIFCYCIG